MNITQSSFDTTALTYLSTLQLVKQVYIVETVPLTDTDAIEVKLTRPDASVNGLTVKLCFDTRENWETFLFSFQAGYNAALNSQLKL